MDAKHIPSKGFEAPLNTNLIERFHGSLKDRTPAGKAGIRYSHKNWLDVVRSQSPFEKEEESNGSRFIRASPVVYPTKGTRKRKPRITKVARKSNLLLKGVR